MNITPSRAIKIGSLTCLYLIVLTCTIMDTRAASLFGDFSCKDWGELEPSRKKTWANAFLAPLSLTIQGLKRAQQDPYNDDPNADEPAIRSIDTFCLSHPHAGASDGAASYLSTLASH
jgi:hypothetical protein